MNGSRISGLPITVVILVLSIAAPSLHGQDERLRTAVEKILAEIATMNRFAEVYTAKIDIAAFAPDAETTVISYTMYAKGTGNCLLVCEAPVKDRGKKILMKGSTMWMYFPRAGKSMIIHPTSSLTGSVSVGDLIGPPIPDLYRYENARWGETPGSVLASFTAMSTKSPYGKINCLYEADRLVCQECFTRSGILLKRIRFGEFIPAAGGTYYATKVRIENAKYPAYYSLIRMSALERAEDFPDYYFTPEGLSHVMR